MTWMVAGLLVVGMGLHVVPGVLYGWNRDTVPLAVWGVGLAWLAWQWTQPVVPSWAIYASGGLPLLGATILTTQLSSSKNHPAIDYGILLDDALLVLAVGTHLAGWW